MKRLILCSIAIATTGLLVGCEQSSPPPPHTGSTSYGYRAAPSSYSGLSSGASSSKPSRYGKLPERTEEAGQVESVRGFPPGHPLHKGDSYSDEAMPHQDGAAPQQGEATQHQMDENGLPQSSSNSDTSLPHSNFNY